MDYMEKINELRDKKRQLLDKANGLANEGKTEDVKSITDQMHGINDQIETFEELAKESQQNASPLEQKPQAHTAEETQNKAPTPFASLGEQLQAIRNVAENHTTDQRLAQINDAVMGGTESKGADGGFAVQTDFAGTIIESAVMQSPLLQRLDRYTCSANANGVRWLAIDETDVTKSVFGGVRAYWAAEGATVAASKPAFREVKMDLEKMMGIAYCTDELLQDAAFMTGFFGRAFSLATDRLLTEAVIDGDGAGKPKGLLKSSALVEVPKEKDQAAGQLVGKNIIRMQARTLTRNRSRYVWLMHPDLEEQLPELSIGSGDAARLLWMPEGGINNLDYQRVMGKPVLFEDNCAAVGSKGDIMLVDPMEYILLAKGNAKQEWSMHVQFLTDQMAFRIVWRCNGAPKRDTAVKLKNSTKLRSPYITLAARK